MLFKLQNLQNNRSTHCGVLEFLQSDEPVCFLPCWMMNHLKLKDGDNICIESVSFLPPATFARFQPKSKDFLDISNTRAVLEHALRSFSCLTTGDIISIRYLNRDYELSVLELKPSNAVSIIECDMEVDFAPAMDSIEEKSVPSTTVTNDDEQNSKIPMTFRPFSGQGNRLNGKVKSSDNEQKNFSDDEEKRGKPNYNYKCGLLQFPRIPLNNLNNDIDEILDKKFRPFTGEEKKS